MHLGCLLECISPNTAETFLSRNMIAGRSRNNSGLMKSILPAAFLILTLMTASVDCETDWFGHPDAGSPTTISYSDSATLFGAVMMLPTPVSTPGLAFSFSAKFRYSTPFYFHIYRPIAGQLNTFVLLFSMRVTPAVSSGQEDFYVASLLGTLPCVHVQPGDRLGILSINTSLSVAVEFMPRGSTEFVVKSEPLTGPPKVNDTVSFVPGDAGRQPYQIYATAFIALNETAADSGSIWTRCAPTLTMRSPDVTLPPAITTTYQPPTGVPGKIGVIGQNGAMGGTGATGPGVLGLIGINSTETGPTGQMGYTGSRGPTGPLGEQNTDTGMTGSTGPIGDMGLIGSTGFNGSEGPVGPMGMNLSYIINGPISTGKLLLSAEYWSDDVCIEAMYIWLAIASFVALIAFIFLIADCGMSCSTGDNI